MHKLSHCVIHTDNFGGDYPDECALSWVDSNGKAHRALLTQDEAEKIAAVLNGNRKDAPRYFLPKPFEYALQPGFEP